MLFSRRFALLGLLGVLTLTGFGCKKIDYSQPNRTASLASGQVKLPTISVDTKTKGQQQPVVDMKPGKAPNPEVLKLRDIMASFQKSQSYRALITIGGATGIKGDLAFSQENGMYGKLTLNNGQTTEIAVKDTRVAVRSSSSTWQEVTGQPEAEQITTLFKAVANRTTTKPIYPLVNAEYKSGVDDPVRGCKMHSMTQFMGNQGYQPMQLCIASGLPTYLSIPSQDGLIEIEYRDIDKVVPVYFPIP